jgi:predicted phosphohydrolase
MGSLRVVCISDTHMQCRRVEVPPGDVLIHAGDLTTSGTLEQLASEVAWLRRLPHTHKVVIAGNHDFCFERHSAAAQDLCDGLTYLQDQEATVAGLRIYGSPWQPRFFDWAFNLGRGEPLRRVWDRIPEGLDLLVTHGPPRSIGDRTSDGDSVGCDDLLAATRRTAPQFHIFGHIHEGYGVHRDGPTTYVNASTVDVRYRPMNAPIVLDVTLRGTTASRPQG